MAEPRLAATTARHARRGQAEQAISLADELGIPLLERGQRGVERMLDDEGLDALIVANDDRLHYACRQGIFFWHPNMAIVRLRSALRGGLADPLARAARLEPGDRLLDCTLGLAADAVVASWYLGSQGAIVGLEASLVIATLVRRGLAAYQHKMAPHIDHIEVQHRRYNVALEDQGLLSGGFDVIYFDPMFEEAVASSNGLAGVRHLACYDRLDPESLAKARQIARRCVVVKGRGNDPWLAALRPDRWVQGRHRRVAYAVFDRVE